MKLSVKKRWGFVHVRGGRVLTVIHDHQIPASTYDTTVDDVLSVTDAALALGATPIRKRVFDAKWTTARIGDLAVEIVARKTDNMVGYAYYCGEAINQIRYVSGGERERVAAWFGAAKGLRFSIPLDVSPEQLVGGVMGLKYSGADLAAARIDLSSHEEMEAALNCLLAAYGYQNTDGMTPTTHMLVTSSVRKVKVMATVHCQPPKHGQQYAAQPFLHELLLSSPDLVQHEFRPPDGAPSEPPPL